MAGMEQLEIHSKSYIVRWVKVEDGHTISWSVQPHKKSINFGIVKHPGVGGSSTATPVIPPQSTEEAPHTQQLEAADSGKPRRPSNTRGDPGNAQELLQSKGFIAVDWFGKCEADKVSMGTHAVLSGQGGMYGLVFDNTFSKTTAKTATFVLLTYPSNAPPNTTHLNLHGAPSSMSSAISLGLGNKGQSPRLGASASESMDSLHSHLAGAPASASRSASVLGRGDNDSIPSTYHVGMLQKMRRKKGQGYARRYFSLDFVSCTLSYYYNRNSSALRGAIPLSLAAIAADERRREISIDSGAEVWHLRASNAKDFEEWTKALEAASNTARGITSPLDDPSMMRPKLRTAGLQGGILEVNVEEEREWDQVESLVSRIVGTRDAVRRLAKDTAAASSKSPSGTLSPGSPISQDEKVDYFNATEKRSFWKRKANTSNPRLNEPSKSSLLALPSPTSVTAVTTNGPKPSSRGRRQSRGEQSIHEHCAALLNDLDSVLAEFSVLITNSRRRRIPAPRSAAASRRSIDSGSNDEFYDAESFGLESSQVVMIQRQSGEETPDTEGEDEFHSDSSSVSSTEDDVAGPHDGSALLFPTKPKSLAPLPIHTPIKRRKVVPPATIAPPSLVSFLRKNVGKDLSTISMPVSSNEPISLIQRQAETLEYVSLLDTASGHSQPNQRLLYVTAFAVSYFSNNRGRERAIRKPFNPMLGETYELVRGDGEMPGNFRFIAEKISHRPVKIACQADSPKWSFAHSPIPTQKFWGKSAELITEGRIRVVLHLKDGTDEYYSWNVATVFLRNIVMGEKYFEPVGTVNVINETTGAKATIEFRSKGMFGGRSEDVMVETFDPNGTNTGTTLVGTWTTCLRILEAGKGAGPEIWHVGQLVEGAETRYGLTEFAASLNQITELEEGKLAITDSRLRKDQQAAENGDMDTAEEIKKDLEDRQRTRRKEMETKGEEWKPRWFAKVDTGESGEEVWKLRGGKEGYWEERAKGHWMGVEDVLNVGGGK